MFTPAEVFSAIVRVVEVPSVKVGAVFVAIASAVKVTAWEMPWTLTPTVLAPALLPSISALCARPLALVVVFVALRVPPPAVTTNVTGTPTNVALFPSRTQRQTAA